MTGPRILVVARGFPSYDAPGRGSFVADHVRGLREADADVVVVSFETMPLRGPEDGRAASARAAETAWATAVADPAACNTPTSATASEIPVARLPVPRTWGALDGSEVPEMTDRHIVPLLAFGRAMAARATAAGASFDVVHAHNGLPDGLAAMALATELGLPLVVTEHDSTLPDRLARPEATSAYRRLHARGRVVAVSESLARRVGDALDAHGGPSSPQLDVLPNPVPLDLFPPAGLEPRDADELLWVGARAAHKGFEMLLHAFALARMRNAGLHLRAIGQATIDDDRRWHALARELGIADGVVMEPAAERKAVAAAMRRAGVFVHPSPFETFGMVAAEALASGLPVAATPSGGVESIVGHDGRSGEIAADHSPEALADAIVRLHDRLPTIDRAALRGTIEERFAPEAVVARTLELYAEAGAGSGGARGSSSAALSSAAARSAVMAVERGPVTAALVVAGHASSASRLAGLPSGAIPVRIVGPTPPARPSFVERRFRRVVGGSPADGRSARAADIRAGWDELAGQAGGRVVIVPAEVHDLDAALDALGEEARANLAPGSLRWLADLQDTPSGAMGR